MAEHWSTEMYFLCWCDPKSDGRKRVSWHEKREKLEDMANAMSAEHDPVLYSGMGSRLTIGGGSKVKDKSDKKTKKTRKAKADAAPAAA